MHPHCGEAGAIGAALEAIRLWRTAARTTSFIGLDAAERIRYRTTCGEETRCHFCTNECLRTFIDVWTDGPDGRPDRALAARRLIVANCEKGAAEDLAKMRAIKAGIDAVKAGTPNLVAVAAREVWKPRHPAWWRRGTRSRPGGRPARRREARREARARCGSASRASSTCTRYAPLFSGYLESLGVLARAHRLLGLRRPANCTGPARRAGPSTRASRRRSRSRTCTTCCR